MTGVSEFNVLVAGIGGQGAVLVSQLLSDAALIEGHNVRVSETFGWIQRGGSVMIHLRLGSKVYGALVPKGRGDFVVGLEPLETLRVAGEYLSVDGRVVMNLQPIYPLAVNIGKSTYPPLKEILEKLTTITRNYKTLDANKLANELGEPRTVNTIMLGAASGTNALPISPSAIKEAIGRNLRKDLVDINIEAFDTGFKTMQGA